MIPLIGYDVSYHRSAFKSGRYGTPTHQQLEDAFEQAKKSVRVESDDKWAVHNKPYDLLGIDQRTIELMVIVPAGDDQYEQLRAAINHFEKVIRAHLGEPVNTRLRTIEGDDPKCVTCGEKADWVRVIRVPGFSGNTHFCTIHAQKQEDFRYSGPSTFFWHQLEPAST